MEDIAAGRNASERNKNIGYEIVVHRVPRVLMDYAATNKIKQGTRSDQEDGYHFFEPWTQLHTPVMAKKPV